MPVVSIKGRFPWGPGAKFDGVYLSKIDVEDRIVRLRLDDVEHDDFWLKLYVPAEVVDVWYFILEARRRIEQVKRDANGAPIDDQVPELDVGPLVDAWLLTITGTGPRPGSPGPAPRNIPPKLEE